MNVSAEDSEIVLHIREFPDSNVIPETNYPE
jgi:hypothetical protein